MSFLTTTGAQSKAQEWTTLDANQISNIKGSFASKGISLMVSAFGYGDNPVTNNKDPVDVANKMAAWVKQWRIDGIDVDWEVCCMAFPNTQSAYECPRVQGLRCDQ